MDSLPSAYMILEVSPDLCERQAAYVQKHAAEFAHLVSWLDMPPASFRGVIVANEVLDSFPVERFVRRPSGVMRQCVVIDGTGFDWQEVEAQQQLADFVRRIEQDIGTELPDGYTSEACLALSPWIGGLAGVLDHGVAFLFDYGVSRREYYAADRGDGWLRCHFRHHAHNDPLVLPGVQDLTAWVDFTAVATTARHAGLDLAGYTPQAQFLMAGGLDDEMRDFASLRPDEQLRLSQQVKTLTLPGEMGEHFKCLALRKGSIEAPSAFSLADRTHTL
jgi:SAM-dependent MidA family methyltransferase